MSKQIQEAYIVAATRLPVAKRKGMFSHVRPDDMLAHAIKSVMAQAPEIDPKLVDDVIVPSETRRYVAQALESLTTKRDMRPPKKHGLMPM